jgi:hypothetical protein
MGGGRGGGRGREDGWVAWFVGSAHGQQNWPDFFDLRVSRPKLIVMS